MSFLARLVLDNPEVRKNWSWGHHPPQPRLRKQFLHGIRSLIRGYLCIRFDLLCSINFRDISGFPKSGAHTLIRGHPRESKAVALDSTNMISY